MVEMIGFVDGRRSCMGVVFKISSYTLPFQRQFVVGCPEVTKGMDGSGEVFKILNFGNSKGRGEFVPGFAVL